MNSSNAGLQLRFTINRTEEQALRLLVEGYERELGLRMEPGNLARCLLSVAMKEACRKVGIKCALVDEQLSTSQLIGKTLGEVNPQ